MSHRHIVLIACCGKKADTACKARDLYQSPLFRKSVAYAERRGLTWAILSAAHGLVMPDDVIAPYDVTLTKMTKAERASWAGETRAQLMDRFPGAEYTVLAGKHYRAAVPVGYCQPHVPMAGMGIGEQLGFLTRDEAAAVPVCADCLAGCHAGAFPDFPCRPAHADERCGAADHEENVKDMAHGALDDILDGLKAERAACRTTIDDQRKRLVGWARQEATSAACVIDAETDRSLTLLASACGSYFQAFNLISRALGA